MTRDRKIVENQGVQEYATCADLPDPAYFKGLALVQSNYNLYKSNGYCWKNVSLSLLPSVRSLPSFDLAKYAPEKVFAETLEIMPTASGFSAQAGATLTFTTKSNNDPLYGYGIHPNSLGSAKLGISAGNAAVKLIGL